MSSTPDTAPRTVIVARAPVRVDFGGGWTDVPPYSTEKGGYVCNVAIARYATARLSARPAGDDGGDAAEGLTLATAALRRAGVGQLSLSLTSDFPIGAGLGGSSAAGVATAAALAAWKGRPLDPRALAELSRAVEVEELRIAGGRQDHYAAAFGGALGLRFLPGDEVEVERIVLEPAVRDAIEHRCIVAYSGEARVSARTILGVLDAYRAGDAAVTSHLDRMCALAQSMAAALRRGAVDELGVLLGEHWAHQRELHPAIPTPRLDELIARALASGALGAKALGASGGGCLVAIAAEGREEQLRAALGRDAELLEVRCDLAGVQVHETAERESHGVDRGGQ